MIGGVIGGVIPPEGIQCPVASVNRPLRIALLSYRSKPHSGGQGVYVRHLSRELAARGHHVEVFSGQPYPELDANPELGESPALRRCRALTSTGTTTRSARRGPRSCGTGPTRSRSR